MKIEIARRIAMTVRRALGVPQTPVTLPAGNPDGSTKQHSQKGQNVCDTWANLWTTMHHHFHFTLKNVPPIKNYLALHSKVPKSIRILNPFFSFSFS